MKECGKCGKMWNYSPKSWGIDSTLLWGGVCQRACLHLVFLHFVVECFAIYAQ